MLLEQIIRSVYGETKYRQRSVRTGGRKKGRGRGIRVTGFARCGPGRAGSSGQPIDFVAAEGRRELPGALGRPRRAPPMA